MSGGKDLVNKNVAQKAERAPIQVGMFVFTHTGEKRINTKCVTLNISCYDIAILYVVISE